jgi:alpha-tubulin suppressor-like RCC1 family protein
VTLAVCSIPQAIVLPVGETAVDIAAAQNFSFILTDSGNVFGFGSDDKNSRCPFYESSFRP